MFVPALLAALVAGFWEWFTLYPAMVVAVLRKKDSSFNTWLIAFFKSLSTAMYYSPLITAFLTGLLLGDAKTGLIVGSTIQLMFIGVFAVGASVPPNPHLASILATALCVLTGASTGESLAIVVPVSILSQVVVMWVMTINTFFTHWADRLAAQGKLVQVDLLNTLNGLGWQLVDPICAFLGVFFGVDLAKTLTAKIPGYISAGLGISTGWLPALGFAMLLMIIVTRKTWAFFFIGFLVATYMKMNAVAIAILGVGMALVIDQLKYAKSDKQERRA